HAPHAAQHSNPRLTCLLPHSQFPRFARNLHFLFFVVPLFGNGSYSQNFKMARMTNFHLRLTRESTSASMRCIAKARKASGHSSSHSKSSAHGSSKSQKKKSLGTPPPPQRAGVNLIDPRVHAQ